MSYLAQMPGMLEQKSGWTCAQYRVLGGDPFPLWAGSTIVGSADRLVGVSL